MSTSMYGIISGLGSILFLLILIGLAVVAGVTLRGRGRGAVVGGLLVLIFERVIGFLIPTLGNAFDVSNLPIFVVQVVFGNLLAIVGTVLLVVGAIWAHRDRTPPAGATVGPQGPTGPIPPHPGGYPGA